MSGDYRELLSPRQVELAVAALALALAVGGPVVGLVVGKRWGSLRRGALLGAGWGLLGPVCWGLWVLYNRIIGRWGLDSVPALLLNLAICAGVGLVAGLLLGRSWSRPAAGS